MERTLRSAIVKSSRPDPDPDSPKAYQSRKGEWGLLNPTQVPLDDELRALARDYASKDADERARVRGTLPVKPHTLLYFAKRSAVFALRTRDLEIVRDGLRAIAMLDTKNIDYRDILMSIAVLHHAAERLGADVAAEFNAAAELAPAGTAKHLNLFPSREPRSKDLGKSWGYREVELDSGIGLASSGFAPYDPQHNLADFGIRIARVIGSDDYRVNQIQLASKLNAVWLEGIDDARVKSILATATAGVSVNARLNPDAHADAAVQSFNVYTIELLSAKDEYQRGDAAAGVAGAPRLLLSGFFGEARRPGYFTRTTPRRLSTCASRWSGGGRGRRAGG